LATGANQPTPSGQKAASVILRFLGSMNLAIMLLVAIAIASVIGTVLRQNEPYQNYIIKFGPYWHEVYKSLGLYDVYSSVWFVCILAFLVVSTSICIIRNAPAIIRSMQRFREDIHERAVGNMPDNQAWHTIYSIDETKQFITGYLHKSGYRTKLRETDQHQTIAAMKGSSNRIGYLLTHIAIVVICVGGLLDGNIPLKIKIARGDLQIETREITVSEIPQESRLPSDNPTFRASVSIPESARVNYAFINIAEGYLLQTLPFSIEVIDFRIEHYMDGQPKSFESDLVIHDPETNEVLETTIAVNHPLIYKGHAIYQASFGDGGTRLKMLMRALHDKELTTLDINGTIGSYTELATPQGSIRLEFSDFRKFNIFPAKENEANRKFVDYGPSFTFKVRQADGTAREYINYMYPVPLEDDMFFLSGVRSEVAEEFRYLYIPVDADNSPDRFFRFQARLHDTERINKIAEHATSSALDLEDNIKMDVTQAMLMLLKLFNTGGFDAVAGYVFQNVPEQNQMSYMQTYLKVLNTALREVYLGILREEGIDTEAELDENYIVYFDNAVNAMNAIHYYGTPFYLQLSEFEEKQATGLQITKAPGQNIVYLGFAMLTAGIFLLFYVSHQRLWFILRPHNNKTGIIMAGLRTRHRHEFAREFRKLSGDLQNALKS
jgi:cytochrome c biogenesis protein